MSIDLGTDEERTAPPVATRAGGPRRRLLRWALATSATVVLVWLVAVAWSTWSARSDLLAANTAVERGRSALEDGEWETATVALERADRLLREASGELGAPHVRLAALVPYAGNSLETASAVADGARRMTAGTQRLLDVVELARTTAADAPAGQVPVAAIATIAEPLRALAEDVGIAVARVADSPTDGVVAPVRDARAEVLTLLEPLAGELDRAADLVAELPAVLGAQGPRTYLFGVSNPAEQRGTGGYIGAYTTLRIHDGELRFGTFRETSELDDLAAGAFEVPDASVYARFGRFGWPFHWQSANLSPDFPTAATTLERLWAARFGEELDGTIVVDPFAYARLVELAGDPVELPDGGALPHDEVVDYLTNRSYLEIPDAEQRKVVLGDIATEVLARFLGSLGDGDLVASARAVTDLVADRHLLLHLRDRRAQAALSALGIDGALQDDPGADLAVAVNSASPTKIDYWLQRELRYHFQLTEDGGADGELTVTLVNGAPSEAPPSVLVGTGTDGLRVGESRSLVSAYCGPGCGFDELPAPVGAPDLPRFDPAVELGHGVHSVWSQLEAGERATLSWTFHTPDAWSAQDGELVLRLNLRHQVAVRPTGAAVRVEVPTGFVVTALPDDAEVVDGDVVWRDDTLTADAVVELRLAPRAAGTAG